MKHKKHQKQLSFRNIRGGFSLIELVFVIAVVGILAAIAIPKLSATRTDAQYAAINKDIQAIISSIQVAATTQDNLVSSLNGEFIMRVSGLSPLRWIAQGNGVRLSKDGTLDSPNNCVLIDAIGQVLSIEIISLPSSPLCQKLQKTYPQALKINLQDSIL